MNIFFDLDGTLLDSKPRLYYLFQNLVPQSTLTFEEYWEFKMNKVSHKDLLINTFSYSKEHFTKFEEKWMKEIEEERWLALDKPFEGIIAYLEKLRLVHEIYVVTARQFNQVAVDQINNLGLGGVFKHIFVTEQKKEKADLIREAVSITSLDWFVGDTGKDIQTGKMLGMNTAAVLTGFLNQEKLEEYKPDLIVNDVLSLNFKV